MKIYFVDGKEITEKELVEIERKNSEYLNSGDMNDWAKIKFIVSVNENSL